MQQIWETRKRHPRDGLEAAIASGFERSKHTALLEKMPTSPHCTRPIKEWLTAGGVDRDIGRPTADGTPQGGVASPLCAHSALHGLEDGVQHAGGPGTHPVHGKQFPHRTDCLRYADDLVVLHNPGEGIQRGTEALQAWLTGRGRERKDAKTRGAHTLAALEAGNGNVGCNFLGFPSRQFPVGKYQAKK